jgi:hypothetical protein
VPDEPPPTPPTPPTPAALRQLGSDGWALLLSAVRTVLAGAHHGEDPELATFRDAPTGRLVGGRLRKALADRLSGDAALWGEVAEVAGQRSPLPEDLVAILEPKAIQGTEDAGDRRDAAARARKAALVAKRRVREARAEQEAWRRRAEGAEARADGLVAELERARAETEALQVELATARATILASELDRDRAVERERRRQDAEIAALEGKLAALRREEEQRRTDLRRQAEAERQAELDAKRSTAEARRRATEDRPPRVVPGRPSRLPRGVEPGTTEAARELLHRGRRLLIDGYNVTKQHRGHLDLETQRNWLIQQVGVLARQRGVAPTVVFDGQTSSGSRPSAALRDVKVIFSEAGVTADDELVLAVVGTDEPVVVVTDDRELTARVTVHGADVIGTRSFLGVLP